MSVINTNVNALLTQGALKTNERDMSVAMERLATGSRINSAKDDAAGLAISSRMNSQIRGLDMAVRNANDAISMIQTAEGASIEVSNMLQRMRELSVQAQNGTYSASTDLAYLSKEFIALQAEIERIADNTQWNGNNILDGTAGTVGTVSYQIGANASQTISVRFADFETKNSDNTVATGDVDTSADTVTISGHGLSTGDSVIYGNGGAADLGGLEGGTTYFAIRVDADTIKLAETESDADAGTEITLTGTGNDAQTFTKASSYGGNIDKTTIGIASVASAAAALTAIDTAIANVDSQRASYGAAINRLQYALDNLTNVSLNANASKSRVLDADYAKETSELARTQIIQQAATAMLSQANTVPQTVLQLLQQ